MPHFSKIAIIGGGTGTYVVTSGLKNHDFDLVKLVAVFDTGGSTGRLRDQFGFLPVGDLRQSLAALAQENHNAWIRDLLLYRFDKGQGLKGHNLGNLILTALQDLTGSTPKALEIATQIFRLKGQVLPITTTSTNLKITYDDSTSLIGEHQLDEPQNGGKKITNIELTKPCSIHPPASRAILEADYIIIGPGDLYASLLPNFIVSGATQAIKKTQAKLIYVVNLMTRYTQSHNLSAQDHVNLIQKYLGKNLDYVIINNGAIPPQIAKLYSLQHEYPVIDDLSDNSSYKIIRSDLASQTVVKKSKSDHLPRALIRHDQDKLTHILLKILK